MRAARGGMVLAALLVSMAGAWPAGAADPVMTLDGCISLALKQNRTIKNAYLDRVAQKYDLRVAEDKFVPTLVLIPSASATGNTAALGGGDTHRQYQQHNPEHRRRRHLDTKPACRRYAECERYVCGYRHRAAYPGA